VSSDAGVARDAEVALEQLGKADRRWEAAVRESAEAPPDSGFASRLLAIADAAEQEAAAFRYADTLGLGWRSQSRARGQYLSYELRAGAPWRAERASTELWDRLDTAVERLWEALDGVALSAIARAFATLSDVARELAAEVEQIDRPVRRRKAG
jgi:hypothetical protein